MSSIVQRQQMQKNNDELNTMKQELETTLSSQTQEKGKLTEEMRKIVNYKEMLRIQHLKVKELKETTDASEEHLQQNKGIVGIKYNFLATPIKFIVFNYTGRPDAGGRVY